MERTSKARTATAGFELATSLTEQIAKRVGTYIPPFVSIDAEGGSVVRFRWNPQPVSARSLGRRRDADYAMQQFMKIGTKLMQTGINLDLAPVLDVSENPMDTYLETRIISEDASITAAIGSAVIEGLHAGGCLSCAKHFPRARRNERGLPRGDADGGENPGRTERLRPDPV